MPGQLPSLFRHHFLTLTLTLASGAFLLASCIADDPSTEPTPSTIEYDWGEEAELWIEGVDQAILSFGCAQFSRMLAPGSTHDYRSMDPAVSYPVHDRAST